MQRHDRGRLYSASDLVNFLGCRHATALDIRQLTTPVSLPETPEEHRLLQERGLAHEHAHLAALKQQGLRVVEIDDRGTIEERARLTEEAMRSGAEVIYQGALMNFPWLGYSDFLMRVDTQSPVFGEYSYEVADTKLSRHAKPSHAIQLSLYSQLLAGVQGVLPRHMHVVLGNGRTVSLRLCEFQYYVELARLRFEQFTASPPASTTGEPCKHCTFCRWSEECKSDWKASDHLCEIAGITSAQIHKLRGAGITTLAALARLPESRSVASLSQETLLKLRSQAGLQLQKRESGQSCLEMLPATPGKGFARLPEPCEGDLYFDMEGNPLNEDGAALEYLFGFVHREASHEARFTCFWAHDRIEEKRAFEQAVDFIMARLEQYPTAHIYHYAAYEQNALKRLAMQYGTREAEVDRLLREQRLVDLYQIVKTALRVSEDSYSIKALEAFYMEKREGEVKSGGQSIVVYEQWKKLGDGALLQQIADYNEVDCLSTLKCHEWLIGLKPVACGPWYTPPVPDEERQESRQDAEERTNWLITALLQGICEEDRAWRELLGHLLEFHRREGKPKWWAYFRRNDMTLEELIEDPECLGGLVRSTEHPPYRDKRSMVHTFCFQPQDCKMRTGDEPLIAGSNTPAGTIVSISEANGLVSLKLGPKRDPLPDVLSLVPSIISRDENLIKSIFRYAESVAANEQEKYRAITSILCRHLPRLQGREEGEAIIAQGSDLLAASIEALQQLDDSHLLIQGPPGAGKTYTCSHAIAELLAQGKRVGVASHSHKAIHNLLEAIEQAALTRGVRFRGIKKSSGEDGYHSATGMIENTTKNEEVEEGSHQLIAGTAWLFAREALDQALDYLFIDEAGQVSLANVIAMGTSARNIILVGDQMQLSQPIQGTHPAGSGVSALDHLLAGEATVPPGKGIFLGVTRRMHPAICRFISDAVYDSRLEAHPDNARQKLVLPSSITDDALAEAGLRFVPVSHEGCSQRSEEEARRLAETYQLLLGQQWIDRDGNMRPIAEEDILVVSPYNMQVNLLQSRLPSGARVGTVDRFQGQEAAVVLISLATSSGEELPRDIEFLYSLNRLNVAISRARCLAAIFASPRLLEVPCQTLEQMKLVNTLCWASIHASSNDFPDTSIQQTRMAG